MGEMSQSEKESMSLGSLVGRNEIAKPWYAKSTMPVSVKAALTEPVDLDHKSKSDDKRHRDKSKSKSERKAEKKERKRDLKRQMKELQKQIE